MNYPDLASPDWYQAISLSERVALLKAPQHKILNVNRKTNAKRYIDPNRAQRYYDRWKTQSPFDRASYFAQRLATEGISEAEFLQILGEPAAVLYDRQTEPPTWLTELAQAFVQPLAATPLTFPEVLKDVKTLGFLELIEPLIRQGRDRLHQGIQTLIQANSDLPFNPDTIEHLLWSYLPGLLLKLANRTLVLELNVARLQGLLQGENPEERFQSFTQRLRQRDVALSILQEYPVLARQLILCIEHWVTVNLEFLQRLCADWQMIRSQFTPHSDPGLLTELTGGAGDSHRGGRSVMIAKFSSGFQIVYKPRSLSLDRHFQELLQWINQRGDHPPFKLLNLCDRGSYGWVEYITAQPCSTKAEIQRFYQRQGGYLAILYALEAVDFHHENLIAAGEQPVLLDLEALFHPHIDELGPKQADQLADRTLYNSVYAIGLLPHRIWSNSQAEGIDISGLGSAAGQLTPHEVIHWEGVGTDEMRLTRKRIELSEEQNRPTLNGQPVNVLHYADAITTGFTQIYQLLCQYRQELLAESSPLQQFADDTIRVIVRATRTYGLLLMESSHPDVLRNALDRDRLLDRLWLAVEHSPYLAKLISFEQADLRNGDIPMFTTRPNSRDLWTSAGARIPDFLERTSLASVQDRLRQLSQSDLARQLWIIRASLTSLSLGAESLGTESPDVESLGVESLDSPPRKNNSIQPLTLSDRSPDRQLIRDRSLTAACAIGDRLATLALRGAEDAAWIGLTWVNERHWSVVPLGLDLYDGLPGVLLFLAYLGAMTNEQRYTDLAQATLTTMLRKVEQHRSRIQQIGGFSGWGGIIYTLTHLGQLWHKSELIAEAEAIVQCIPDCIHQDELFDVLGGAAGCIGSLRSLHSCAPSDATLDVAMQCGEHLLKSAQPQLHGIGWPSSSKTTQPLTGFSHGTAGIAWALLELSALTGETRFRTAAQGAIAYERHLFSPEQQNWPDLREFANSVQTGRNDRMNFMTAWCHGAPGIGLGRVQCLPYLQDAQMVAEIEAAIATTLTQGFGGNHSLCHGSLGNLDLLLQARDCLQNKQLQPQIDRLAEQILGSIQQQGWQCGIPLGVESPGLMTGLAGIGYGLLRLVDPNQVPSILVLEPPKPTAINLLSTPSIAPTIAPLQRSR
ncbi:type 2 lanthipeptide synthetase LanM family protein [Alkalinema pantanalense CENA528]|uniref:type 2 lanthipeptide synthetase LanM family protein n=1 Tax=Alkalinema pantanalense TaxID=1620705 RepID=UPI003D6F6149